MQRLKEQTAMKKYKTLLIIFLIFMCVIATLQAYRAVNDIRAIAYDVIHGYTYVDVILMGVFALIIDIVILGMSVFGIVVLAKILKDNLSFKTSDDTTSVSSCEKAENDDKIDVK